MKRDILRFYLHMVVIKLRDKIYSPLTAWDYMLGITVITFLVFVDKSVITNVNILFSMRIVCTLWVVIRLFAIPSWYLEIPFRLTPKNNQVIAYRDKYEYIDNSTNEPKSIILPEEHDSINKQHNSCQVDSYCPRVYLYIPSILESIKRIVRRKTTKCK